jgi:hypothetical protein
MHHLIDQGCKGWKAFGSAGRSRSSSGTPKNARMICAFAA